MSDANSHIFKLREDFTKGELNESDINHLPALQFEKWMQEAIEAKVMEVQACSLSTVSKDNKPSCRIVYLREFDKDDFYFYTNFKSKKSIDIEQNNNVCLTFFWPELERQIRIEGNVTFASKEKSDLYFNARPTESKIGSWSSPQSKTLKNRDELNNCIKTNTEKFSNQNIPRPDFWGGYVINANYYEFWQGRKSRLHDRIAYTFINDNWNIERLAP